MSGEGDGMVLDAGPAAAAGAATWQESVQRQGVGEGTSPTLDRASTSLGFPALTAHRCRYKAYTFLRQK